MANDKVVLGQFYAELFTFVFAQTAPLEIDMKMITNFIIRAGTIYNSFYG